LGPNEVTVGSKWGYTYTANWRVDAPVHEVKDLSVATLRRQVGESRQMLGPNLRLYQIHSATLESGVLDDPAVLEELAPLRASGILIGLTVTGPRQAETIERALRVGGFDVVQATWNLLERGAGSALATAHANGIGVIIKEALANGRLTTRGAVPELLEVARSARTTPDALALAAAVAQPWADVVLSGATTVKQLESNLVARASNSIRSCSSGSMASVRTHPATGRRAPRSHGTERPLRVTREVLEQARRVPGCPIVILAVDDTETRW
jgi:aryl-alcohol dehydrogenase-like predicted oxidoreductase